LKNRKRGLLHLDWKSLVFPSYTENTEEGRIKTSFRSLTEQRIEALLGVNPDNTPYPRNRGSFLEPIPEENVAGNFGKENPLS
jgi:hypothetical protein